jgi:hypothetical protein
MSPEQIRRVSRNQSSRPVLKKGTPVNIRILSPMVLAGALVTVLAAQTPQVLDLNFPNFAAQAKKKAEVDLDASTLAGALQMAGKKDAEGALSGVKAVHVRNYEFAAAGAYKDSDLDPLRRQVAANSAWSRFLNVKEEHESTEIFFLQPQGNDPGGFLLISAEAKEVTVVEILGTIELSHMQELVKSTISYDLKASAKQ